MLKDLCIGRRLRWLLLASLLAIAIIAYATATPTNWFKSAQVTGTIFASPTHTWIVDDDGPAHFGKIQEAINAASPGDTIYVRNGTYWECIVVNKAVRIIGEDKFRTIIDADWVGGAVVIRADNVIINGFTIRNSRYYYWGVRIESQNTVVINNIILNTFNGIEVVDSNNIISNNTIANNLRAIMLGYVSNNTLSGNNIIDNEEGMDIGSSNGNVIYHNNFTNNALQIKDSDSTNVWDDGYPSGGNYWSDYVGGDIKSGSSQDLPGSDGIGDTPYIIDMNNQDHYPLIKPWTPRIESIITVSAEPATVTVGSTVTVSGAITPVRASVNVTVYYRLVGEGIWNTLTTLKTNSTGSYTYAWKTAQIGTHELKAVWLGDETTLPAESCITAVNVNPIHDVAIVNVAPSATEVYVGWRVNITVVVKNEGNVTETFTVSCKYELESVEYLIGTQTVNNLVPNANTSITFAWTTTDLTVHTIKAESAIVLGETDTADNTLKSPTTVKVKILGDVNNDDKVDIKDIAQATVSFGAYPNHPRWNPQADINQDDKIDVRDLALIARNFGKTYP